MIIDSVVRFKVLRRNGEFDLRIGRNIDQGRQFDVGGRKVVADALQLTENNHHVLLKIEQGKRRLQVLCADTPRRRQDLARRVKHGIDLGQ